MSTMALAKLCLAISTLLMLNCAVQVGANNNCPLSLSLLKAARLEAAHNFVERVNQDMAHYIAMCERYYTPDTSMILRGVGAYTGLEEVKEYGYVLFEGINGVRPIGMGLSIDDATLRWSSAEADDGQVEANNTLTFNVNLVLYIDQDPATGQWAMAIGGIRTLETLRFAPCSDKIELDYVVQTPEMIAFYLSGNTVDNTITCQEIGQRCQGNLTAYDSFEQCLEFFNALDAAYDPAKACPYALSSNTTACRHYHSTNAYADPEVHCQHTEVDSMTCVDQCAVVCQSCPKNGKCDVHYGSLSADAAEYSCGCQEGYSVSRRDPVTQSALECSPQKCLQDWQCPGSPVSAYCDTQENQCRCRPSFSWNATLGLCECPADVGRVYWNLGSGSAFEAPACIPSGRCLNKQHCHAQSWNQVECRQTDPPNLLLPWLSCQCNAGFVGGFDGPCICNKGSIQWSPRIQGEVCLAAGECVADYNCPYPSRCILPQDPSKPIGVCVNA
ncbi:zinc finger protein [Mollivirus sibericum]|uniref:zinc finger protein n=1 Tax=Mollivirus sibericum TaxID=1678078 RepID=UPI0006B2DB15|nr:zinc finger protein [Mollivirus sibericum]ALD62009.1 zinc finger protein [Mollivirus sibericum]